MQADQTARYFWNNTRRCFIIAGARRISPTEAMLGGDAHGGSAWRAAAGSI
jgi:hypothetical protein